MTENTNFDYITSILYMARRVKGVDYKTPHSLDTKLSLKHSFCFDGWLYVVRCMAFNNDDDE